MQSRPTVTSPRGGSLAATAPARFPPGLNRHCILSRTSTPWSKTARWCPRTLHTMSDTARDTLGLLRTTGAVRDFRPEAVPDDVVYRILDTARFAPNGGNRQAWKVV